MRQSLARSLTLIVVAVLGGPGLACSGGGNTKPAADAQADVTPSGSGGAGATGGSGGGPGPDAGDASTGRDAPVSDSGPDIPASPDAADAPGEGGPETAGDTAGTGSCVAPADCTALGSRDAAGAFCSGASWSCIAGRCTWECSGGRTCTLTATGCLECPGDVGSRPSCPGDCCVVDPTRTTTVEAMTCGTPTDTTTWTCTGHVARLADGTLCTIQGVATGAIRWSIGCGGCLTMVRQN